MRFDYLKNANTSLFLIDCSLENNLLIAKLIYVREKITSNNHTLFNDNFKCDVTIENAMFNRKTSYAGIMFDPIIVTKIWH